MACTRGCVGIGICEGNISCIQFQNGAGTDCVGIAVGFSRIQINALGEIEICSNVGGVCTCNSPTGSDSVVDDGNGQYTHTAQDGTIEIICVGEAVSETIGGSAAGGNVLNLDTDCDGTPDIEICEGFCSIVSANDCAEGVGADYVIQDFSIVNDVLTINSLPKPEHLVVQVPPSFIFQNIAAGVPAGTTIGLELTDTDITNPSNCLPMDVCIRSRIWGTVQNFETYPGYVMTHDIRLLVDFGAGQQFAHVVSSQNRLPPPGPDTSHSNNDGEIEYCFVLAAGATQNVEFTASYNCTTGPCMESTYEGLGYVIEGHTQ